MKNKCINDGVFLGLFVSSILFTSVVSSQNFIDNIPEDISSAEFDNFTKIGITYLQNSHSTERILHLHKSTHTHYDSNLTYTILKAKLSRHRGHITTVVRHRDGGVTDSTSVIYEDWLDYIDNLPTPYGKIGYSLRSKIRSDYDRLPPIGELEINESRDYPITIIKNDGSFVPYESSLNKLLEIANQSNVIKLVYGSIPILSLDSSVPKVNGDYFHDNLGLNGSQATILFVDTGVNKSHPDLDSDMITYDFNQTRNDTNDYAEPPEGHGTPALGVIASRNLTYTGMAFGAEIIAGKKHGASDDDVITGSNVLISEYDPDVYYYYLNYIADADGSHPIAIYLDYLANVKNIIAVVPAGNNGSTIRPPGGAFNIISVGATDGSYNYERVADFSGTGPTTDGRSKPDVVAPGTSITTTSAGWAYGNDFADIQGTSFSAPHVVGVAALLYDYAYKNNVEINPLIVKAVILNSAKKIADKDGGAWDHDESDILDDEQGAGLVDAQEAYNTLSDGDRVFYVHTDATHFYDVYVPSDSKNLTCTVVWNRPVTNYSDPTPPSLPDIDIYLEYDGGEVDYSYSSVDNVEHIYYDVPSGDTGYYTLEVADPIGFNGKYALVCNHDINYTGCIGNVPSTTYGDNWIVSKETRCWDDIVHVEGDSNITVEITSSGVLKLDNTTLVIDPDTSPYYGIFIIDGVLRFFDSVSDSVNEFWD